MPLTDRTYRKAEVRVTGPDAPVAAHNPVRVAVADDVVRLFDPTTGFEVASIAPDVELAYSEGIVVYRDSATGVEWYVERIGCGCGGQD